MKVRVQFSGLICLLAGALGAGMSEPFLAAAEHQTSPACFVTNIVQFRSLSGEQFLNGCAFELRGVVTLVDANRRDSRISL